MAFISAEDTVDIGDPWGGSGVWTDGGRAVNFAGAIAKLELRINAGDANPAVIITPTSPAFGDFTSLDILGNLAFGVSGPTLAALGAQTPFVHALLVIVWADGTTTDYASAVVNVISR